MVNADGMILLANAQLAAQFGYDRHELLGQSVDRLVPDRFRTRHPEHRSAFLTDPGLRATARRDLIGLRKDGTEFPVAIILTPMTTADGVYVVASVQ